MTKVEEDLLTRFKERFDEINSSKSERAIKSVRFEALKTDLECAYQIPLYGCERITAFKRAFPEVMDLHRKASEAMVI